MPFWRGIAFAAAAALWLAAWAGPAAAGAEDDVRALLDRVNALRDAGKDAEAVPLAEKALSIAENELGPDSEAAIAPLLGLGAMEMSAAMGNRGNWGKAETFLKRALVLREKHPNEEARQNLGKLLFAMAFLHSYQKRTGEARAYFDRYFDYVGPRIAAKKLRPDDIEVANAVTMEWGDFLLSGRTADMQQRFQHMIALSEQHLGYEHPYTGILVFQLAVGLDLQQNPAQAAPLYERFLAIAQKALEDPKADLGPSVTRDKILGNLNRAADRLEKADRREKAQEALALARKARAAEAPQAAQQNAEAGDNPDALAQQADELEKRGRSADAAPLRKRVAVLRQQALGANPRDPAAQAGLIAACERAAEYYSVHDLMDEAEPMFRCVLLVRELQGDKLGIAGALDNLGNALERLGRLNEAEQALKRAIALFEEVGGSDAAGAGPLRTRVVTLIAKQGRADEAAKYVTATAAATAKLFERPPGVRNALADLDNWDERAKSRYSAAEWRSMQMDHQIIEMMGPNNPPLAGPLALTASLFEGSNDWPNAVAYLDRAASAVIGSLKLGGHSSAAREEQGDNTGTFAHLAKAGYRLAQVQPTGSAGVRDRLFVTAQWAQHSAAAGALAQMAARPQTDPGLAKLARERQDLASERRELNASLIAAVSLSAEARQQRAAKDQEARRRIAEIDKRIEEIDASLLKQFPKYAQLVNPTPLTVAAVQGQLKPNEALALFLDTPATIGLPAETMAWVVTRDKVRWARADIGGPVMAEAVFALRCGLDVAAWRDEGAAACEKAVKARFSDSNKPLPYDLARAHGLYQALFGPFEDLIKDKRLLIVASGPLTSLPLEVLVTEKPAEALPSAFEGYRGVKWLGRKHAIAVLPSVASLSVLRKETHAGGAAEPYLGYGDPRLDGHLGCSVPDAPKTCPGEGAPPPGAPPKRSLAARGFGAYFRSGRGDVAILRAQCPLPEASMELKCVARSLKAPANSARTQAAATETAVKHARLDKYRVLHFATHGLLAGETEMVGSTPEPALLLTPPAEATDEDDGLLTASEISQLKLNADWVVLSACNTASGEKSGAEALSGLARAFFYSGARSLLVSHWEVDSYAATMLTTAAFKELSVNPGIGPAKALQRSQAALMDDAKRPYNAHPSFWAPFVLVGEGTRSGARAAGAAPGATPQPSAAAKPAPAGSKPKAASPSAAKKPASTH